MGANAEFFSEKAGVYCKIKVVTLRFSNLLDQSDVFTKI
jgi:hypothetical protein